MRISRLVCGVALVVLGLTTSSVGQQQGHRLFCNVDELPFSSNADKSVATLSNLSFGSDTGQGSGGDVTLTNTGANSIARAIFLVDFIDGTGQRIITIPFLYRDDGQRFTREWLPQALQPASHVNVQQHIRSALSSGKDERLFGVSDFSVTECPRTARVTFVTLQYSSGETYHFEEPNWRVESMSADFRAVPVQWGFRALDLSAIPNGQLPCCAVALLNIDEHGCGHVKDVSPALPQLVKVLRTSVSDWVLAPAATSGTPASSDVALLVMFRKSADAAEDWNRAPSPLPRKFVAVHVGPPDPDRGGRYMLRYGMSEMSGEPPQRKCTE